MTGIPAVSPCFPRSPIDAWLEGELARTFPECSGAGDPASRLERARFSLLRRRLAYAAQNSRLYRKRLAGHDLDIHSLEEFRRLPFTLPEDLRESLDLLCISPGSVRRIVSLGTSGTAGVPKRIMFSRGDLERTASFFAAGMSQLARRGQRLLVLLPGAQRPDGVADLLRQALAPAGVQVFSGNAEISDASLPEEIPLFRPHALVAGPGQLAKMLEMSRRNPKLRRAAACLGGILSSGDLLSPELRTSLEAEFQCPVLDHWGMTETCFGGGVECLAQSGYHLRELDLFIEILSPLTGEPVPDGETGEIVLTTLRNEAMPLIRYRTGDAAGWLPGPCPCGSPLRRLSGIKGRYVRHGGQIRLAHLSKGTHYDQPASTSA